MLGWFKKKNNDDEAITQSDNPLTQTDKTEAPPSNGTVTAEVQTTPDVVTTEYSNVNVGPSFEQMELPPSRAYEEPPPPLTYKEARALKKARYEDVIKNPKFKQSFVLLNKKTGQVVEIKAASSFHACNIIGWKPNKVTILAVNSEITSTINKT
jgi:hypothetical protein